MREINNILTVNEIKKELDKEIYRTALSGVNQVIFDAVKEEQISTYIIFNSKVTSKMIDRIVDQVNDSNYQCELDSADGSTRLTINIKYN